MGVLMSADPLPLHLSPAADPGERRRTDLVERLDWVIRRRLDELPDTLVAALRAAGLACDRSSSPQTLLELLDGTVSQTESRAAAS
jgi:hypothetical protein